MNTQQNYVTRTNRKQQVIRLKMEDNAENDIREDDLGKYSDLFSRENSRPVRLSLHLIVKRHLAAEAKSWCQDKILESLNNISHLRLDRENIREIDGLELLGQNVRNLYLQMNIIEKIENLDCLSNLQFITLAGNRIRKVENLTSLQKLFFLDLSENQIANFDIDEFPQSLIILNLKGNPCDQHPDHRGRIIQDLPKLRQLDGVDITNKEKLEAGFEVSDDEEDDEEEEEVNSKQSQNSEYVTSNILIRSQQRLEENLQEHLNHFAELDSIRERTHLPVSQRSKRTPRPATTEMH